MGKNLTVVLSLLLMCAVSRADFKYTEQSKVTGGALVNMTKTLGVFSKSMRQVTEPQTSVKMVKGNRMREEMPQGQVRVIDLEGRRFINIDSANKTYSIMTFDEFKAAMQRAMERAKEEQAKAAEKHRSENPPNVKMIPKFDAQATGATKNILGIDAKEMKMKMEMLMQSDDPKTQQQLQNAAYTFNADSWLAPSVHGYSEMHDFYVKMAKELNWVPGTMMGGMGGGMTMGNPQLGPGMEEFRKNAIKVDGMPLLTYISFGMSATGTPPAQGTQGAQGGNQAQNPPPAQQQQQPQTEDNSIPTSTKGAITKGLGGLFGKKKKQDQEQQQAAQSPASSSGSGTSGSGTASGQPTSSSASLMDMTVEITSFSNNSLDSALFDVPAGYTQVQKNPDEMFGGKQR